MNPILNQFMDQGYNQDLLIGYLARALRSFASFMREPDLAYKLMSLLEKEDKSTTVNMDPQQDVKKHVDIVVEYKGTVVAVPGHNDIILNSGSVDDANNDSALTINEFGDVTLDRNGSSTKTLIRTEINGIVNYSIRYAI